jgi:hypothetical protein
MNLLLLLSLTEEMRSPTKKVVEGREPLQLLGRLRRSRMDSVPAVCAEFLVRTCANPPFISIFLQENIL